MDQNGKPRQAGTGIRSTALFIIFLDTMLGQGATSRVYTGRHKKTGKRVACKVPHLPSLFRGGTDMEKESQVLLKLRHPNIVCLEAIEKDQISKDNILIMELCTGGSLYDVLEKPENCLGVPEKVFIQVLTDVTCGTKYLRDNGFIHRDVKPGNIMCYIDENGRTIFKLADFGAARQLTDEENFTSLHGTEEYLHPNIYERAVLRRHTSTRFDARVDLWSIGATLYHVATGALPFRPHGGRKNSAMMFYLTTKKASGVISGVQTAPGEHNITWSTELPDTCQLSVGLKKLVTPMLAGLLEYNPPKVWSFNKFFDISQSITTKKPLDIFWVSQSALLKVYASPRDTFAEFQELIAAQTNLSASKQSLSRDGEPFRPDAMLRVSSYPHTSETNPIMLCNKEPVHLPCQIFPPNVAEMPELHPRYSPQNDQPMAKCAVAVAHALQRRQRIIHHMHTFFDQCTQLYRITLFSDLYKLRTYCSKLNSTIIAIAKDIDAARHVLRIWTRNQSSNAVDGFQKSPQQCDDVGNTIHQLSCKLDFYNDQHDQIKKQHGEVSTLLERLHSDLVGSDVLGASWQLRGGCDVDKTGCVTKLVHLTGILDEVYRRFTKDKKAGRLSYNEEQIHKMEKLTLGEKMKQAENCAHTCEDKWRERHHELMVWCNKAHNYRTQIGRADTLLTPLVKRFESMNETVTDITKKCWNMFECNPPVCQAAVHKVSSAIQTAKQISHIPQITNGTQTSRAFGDLSPQTNGVMTDHHCQHTIRGQPLVMGLERTAIRSSNSWRLMSPMSPSTYCVPPQAWSAPARIAAPELLAKGPSGPRSPRSPSAPVQPCAPLAERSSYTTGMTHALSDSVPVCREIDKQVRAELKVHDPLSGETQSVSRNGHQEVPAGPRMIKVPHHVKQEMKNFQLLSGIPAILEESKELVDQLAAMSLPLEGEMESIENNSIFLPTLMGAEGGCLYDNDDDGMDSFIFNDIKRPPRSYRESIDT